MPDEAGGLSTCLFSMGVSSYPFLICWVGYLLMICRSFKVLDTSPFSEMYIANVFSHSWLPFHFLNDTFWSTDVLNFSVVQLIGLFLLLGSFYVRLKKSLLIPQPWR